MTALEFLNRPAMVEKRLNAALRKVELYKSLTERITVSFGGETVSRTRDMTANETAIIKLMEAKDTVSTLKNEYEAIIDETVAVLSQLEEDYGDAILYMHYLKQMSFKAIGKELHLGHSQVYNHHDLAVSELEKHLKRRHDDES